MLKSRFILHTLMLMLAAWAVVSCSEEEVKKTPNGPDPEMVQTLFTHDVLTLVSDSGRTRYRIT
ncbi:MAG: LPS export ABC transporter periplasmic protein LptC, partial [Sodaliphilus sp.]|nr:LPS export ABC transporter periplasmic protein LptC [Sodaliphilus sp.]